MFDSIDTTYTTEGLNKEEEEILKLQKEYEKLQAELA